MEFIDIKKTPYLSVEQMNAIYNNFLYLNEVLVQSGFDDFGITDNSVDYTAKPIDIINAFNTVEKNILSVHNSLIRIFKENEKFFKYFSWTPTTTERKTEVWRWIDWLYEAKKLVNIYEVLFDVDGTEIIDVNNEKVLVLKGE